jgi:ribosomal protein L29
MNASLKHLLLGAGGVALFCGAFVGFAKWRGADLHELPWIGLLFPLPEDDAGAVRVHPDAELHPRPRATPAEEEPVRLRQEPAKVARAGLLDAFTLESPYSASELQALVDALKESHREAEIRLEAIAAREAAVEAREQSVADREQELAELKARLDEMTQRAASGSLDPQRSKAEQLEDLTWSAKSALFADGDAETLAARLVAYPPIEAARILAGLPPERAQELRGALPESRWREYAEAYASMRALTSGNDE